MKYIQVRLLGRVLAAVEWDSSSGPPQPATTEADTPQGIKGGTSINAERRWSPQAANKFGFER